MTSGLCSHSTIVHNNPSLRNLAIQTITWMAFILLAACGGGGGSSSTGNNGGGGSGGTTGTAPSIQTQPSNQTVASGHAATFTVAATGTGSLQYQWMFGSTSVGTNSPTLTISPALYANAGTYSVIVTNAQGNVTSTSVTLTVNPAYADMSGATTGTNANTNGAVSFGAASPWNTNIAQAAVSAQNVTYLNAIGSGIGHVHADWGTTSANGMNYIVVDSSQPMVPVTFSITVISDPSPYPVPANAPINDPTSNGYVIVVDKSNNRLYEMFGAQYASNAWSATNGAVFELDQTANVRPAAAGGGWNSATVSGLPIFPGLVRYEEAITGTIPHALNMYAPLIKNSYFAPATNCGPNTGTNAVPAGTRIRLSNSFVIPTSFATESKAIATALQTYGAFVVDTGTAWWIAGTSDSRWSAQLQSDLDSIPLSAFEVVDTGAASTAGC